MSAGRICSGVVVTAAPGETVRDAARRMKENNVGVLVVLASSRRPVGILTDRDVVTRVIALDRDPTYTTIDEVMTTHLQFVNVSAPIDEALHVMRKGGVRRLVVLTDDGMLAGLLSVDDIFELLAVEAGAIGDLLRKEAPTIHA